MKFSVLLPTRNRLDLLRYAVETVRRQDYEDWEVIISDNASTEDIGGYVRSLADPRIRCLRTDDFLPVTDNWNRALEASVGEYVVMLGDDDCLMPQYFSRMLALIERFNRPDLVYTEGLQYAYPGVIPDNPEPFTQVGYCEFMRAADSEPWLLDRHAAEAAVRESFEFRIAFSYNMQHSLISRRMIDRLSENGPFFRSPYPDYYASNALFLLAGSIVVDPRPAVIIGMSPKSFGFFYFNQNEAQGVQFLNNASRDDIYRKVERYILPGSDMNTSWLLSMATVREALGPAATPQVSFWRYRFMQYTDLFRRRASTLDFLRTLLRTGNVAEIATWSFFAALWRVSPMRTLGYIYGIHRSHPDFDPRRRPVPSRNILELFELLRTVPAPKT